MNIYIYIYFQLDHLVSEVTTTSNSVQNVVYVESNSLLHNVKSKCTKSRIRWIVHK